MCKNWSHRYDSPPHIVFTYASLFSAPRVAMLLSPTYSLKSRTYQNPCLPLLPPEKLSSNQQMFYLRETTVTNILVFEPLIIPQRAVRPRTPVSSFLNFFLKIHLQNDDVLSARDDTCHTHPCLSNHLFFPKKPCAPEPLSPPLPLKRYPQMSYQSDTTPDTYILGRE